MNTKELSNGGYRVVCVGFGVLIAACGGRSLSGLDSEIVPEDSADGTSTDGINDSLSDSQKGDAVDATEVTVADGDVGDADVTKDADAADADASHADASDADTLDAATDTGTTATDTGTTVTDTGTTVTDTGTTVTDTGTTATDTGTTATDTGTTATDTGTTVTDTGTTVTDTGTTATDTGTTVTDTGTTATDTGTTVTDTGTTATDTGTTVTDTGTTVTDTGTTVTDTGSATDTAAEVDSGPICTSGLNVSAAYTTGIAPAGIVAGDFNGDGKLDLVVVNAGDAVPDVMVLLGDGAGHYSPSPLGTYAVGNFPWGIAAGDFNKDGNLDIAVANIVDSTVTVIYSIGKSSSTTMTLTNDSSVAGPYTLVAADLDGSGYPSLIVGNSDELGTGSAVGVEVFPNSGGVFGTPTIFLAGTTVTGVAAGDFNGDGKIDVAAVDDVNNAVVILTGDGLGSFTPGASFGAGQGAQAISTGQFNSDGILDLAVSNTIENTMSVLLGNGNGTFQTQVAYTVDPTGPGGPYGIATGDFGGRGLQDIVTANFNDQSPTVSLFLNTGSGGAFNPAVTYSSGGGSPGYVAAGDFDGDGKVDIAVTNFGDGSTISGVTIFLGSCQ